MVSIGLSAVTIDGVFERSGHRSNPEPITAKALCHGEWSTSRRAGRVRRDALIQFLIDDLHRTVDFGIGYAKLMRNQLHQQVDAFDGRRATSDRPGR